MKFLFGIFTLLWALNSQACQEKLMKTYPVDSSAYYLNVDAYDYTYKCTKNDGCLSEEKDKLFAVRALKALLKEKDCAQDEIDQVCLEKTECHRFDRKGQRQLVCYLETSFGFFYFNRDFVDGAQIVYNRWD